MNSVGCGQTVTFLYDYSKLLFITNQILNWKMLNHDASLNMIRYDYSGYGQSSGKVRVKSDVLGCLFRGTYTAV